MEKEKALRGPNPYLPPCTVKKSIYKAKTENFLKIALSMLARNTKVNIEGEHRQRVHGHCLGQSEMDGGNR